MLTELDGTIRRDRRGEEVRRLAQVPDFDKPENAGGDECATGAAPDPAAVLVYMTFPDLGSASAAGEALVERNLAACVNIMPGMVSIYRWKGQLQRDGEVVMLVKTRHALADAVMAEVRARHPYENPAMLTIPVMGGAALFLAWIAEETGAGAAG